MRRLEFVMCVRTAKQACHSLWSVQPYSRGRAHTQWARTHGAGGPNDPSQNSIHQALLLAADLMENGAVGPVTALSAHQGRTGGDRSCCVGAVHARQVLRHVDSYQATRRPGTAPRRAFVCSAATCEVPWWRTGTLAGSAAPARVCPDPCAESWPRPATAEPPSAPARPLGVGQSG